MANGVSPSGNGQELYTMCGDTFYLLTVGYRHRLLTLMWGEMCASSRIYAVLLDSVDWFVRHTAQHETNFVWLSLLLLLNIWQGRRLLHNLLHHLAIRMSFPFHRHLSITHILFLSLHLHLVTYFHFLVHTIRSRSISRSCEWHKTNFVEYVTLDIWLESTTNRWLLRGMP